MRTYSDVNFDIIYPDEECYALDKQFLTIKSKNQLKTKVKIFGYDYYFYYGGSPTSTLSIDLSDIMNYYSGGEISVYDEDDNLLLNFEYSVLQGRSIDFNMFVGGDIRAGAFNKFYFSWFFKFADTISFEHYNKTTHEWDVLTTDLSTSDDFNFYDYIHSNHLTNERFRFVKIYNDVTEIININFIPLIEGVKYKLVHWRGETGTMKSWFFEVVGSEYKITKELNLQTETNGYRSLKNKQENLTFIERNCNLQRIKYLRDILFSEEIYVMDESAVVENEVVISGNSIKIKEKENIFQDFQFTVNFKKYDKI